MPPHTLPKFRKDCGQLPSPPGLAPGQIYTYPARCWRKRRRLNILEDPRLRPCEFKIGKELGGEGRRRAFQLPWGPSLQLPG